MQQDPLEAAALGECRGGAGCPVNSGSPNPSLELGFSKGQLVQWVSVFSAPSQASGHLQWAWRAHPPIRTHTSHQALCRALHWWGF